MTQQVGVVAFIEVEPGQEAVLEEAARACITLTRQEAGCLDYTLHRDRAEASRFVFVETWETEAALDAHMRAPHLQDFFAVVGRTAKRAPVVHRLQRIA